MPTIARTRSASTLRARLPYLATPFGFDTHIDRLFLRIRKYWFRWFGECSTRYPLGASSLLVHRRAQLAEPDCTNSAQCLRVEGVTFRIDLRPAVRWLCCRLRSGRLDALLRLREGPWRDAQGRSNRINSRPNSRCESLTPNF